MFKRLFVIPLLFCLMHSINADIFLLEPIEAALQNNDSIELGKIAKGETVKVIIEKKSGKAFEWNTISVNTDLLPPNWSFIMQESDKTLIAALTVPRDSLISTQRIEFFLQNKQQPHVSEKFSVTILVAENLLKTTMENLNQTTIIYEPIQFKLILNNESIAQHSLKVESTLPNYWFETKTVEVLGKEKKEVLLQIYPIASGEKSFVFSVNSQLNDNKKQFFANIKVLPTLKSKYTEPLFGFSFFTISLLPYYLINGFLALLS